jgi:hypothetical protein
MDVGVLELPYMTGHSYEPGVGSGPVLVCRSVPHRTLLLAHLVAQEFDVLKFTVTTPRLSIHSLSRGSIPPMHLSHDASTSSVDFFLGTRVVRGRTR